MEELYYGYGVYNGEADLPAGLSAVKYNKLSLAYKEVDESEFGDQFLPDRLKDVEWVAKKATNHQQVLQEINDQVAVVPLSFGTVFKCSRALNDTLYTKYEYFHEILDKIGENKEWGVKLFCNKKVFSKWLYENDEKIKTLLGQIREATPGKKFILKKKLEGDLNSKTKEALNKAIRVLYERLTLLDCEYIIQDPVHPNVTARKESNVFNMSLLLDRRKSKKLEDTIQKWNSSYGYGQALFPELTGPWPPYNFVKKYG